MTQIHELLIKFLKTEITKQQLKESLNTHNIPIKAFNNYILSILSKSATKNQKRKISKPKNISLQTNEFLDEDFIKDVKKSCLNRKMHTYQGLFKLSKDQVQKRIFQDRKLQSHFVLRKHNPFCVDDIGNRLMKSCVEYGILKYGDRCINVVYEGMRWFVMNVIDKCEGQDERIVEEIRKMFPALLSIIEKNDGKFQGNGSLI